VAVMDGYVRVSQRGGREGEAYRSPAIQRDEIQRWAKNNGVTIGKIVTDEDVSGAKPVAQRRLEELIARAEAGVSGGVVVHRADRFGRDHNETLMAAKRLKDAGARLVGVADGVDSDQPHGKWILNFMSLQAEDYLDRVKANWSAATRSAVAEGKHIAAKPPLGYLRADQADPQYDSGGELVRDARLVVDPETAPALLTAFELRARGRSYRQVIEFLEGELGRGFAKSSLAGIFKNRAYIGEARGPGGLAKAGAHVAIVPEDLFKRVQATVGIYRPRDGSLAKQALLAGMVACASCGHKMRTLGSTNRSNGKREASYVCTKFSSKGQCAAPAAAKVRLVDEYVAQRLMEDEDTAKSAAASAEARYLLAREAVRKAEEALDAWVDDPKIIETLDKERFRRGLAKRQEALDEANRAMWDVQDVEIPDDAEVVWLDGKPVVYELWGEDREADRRHLRRYVSAVSIEKADPARRRWQPIGERVKITWVGQGETTA
jgi:DNA invertase Pin-like site-specific DNA recombinase